MWAGVGPRVEKGKKPGDYGRRRTAPGGRSPRHRPTVPGTKVVVPPHVTTYGRSKCGRHRLREGGSTCRR